MKIRMLVSVSGHADPNYDIADFAYAPGQVVDVAKSLAAAWIASGQAEKVKPAPVPEPAAEPVQEGA